MRRPRVVPGLVALILLVGYALTGLCAVAPGEAVVVRRFGRVRPSPLGPGLHWTAPRGIDRRDRVRLDAVRRLEVGGVGVAGPEDDPGGGEFLTGDRNLLRARAAVQYRVADPVAYATRVADPDALLARLADAAMARALAARPIDAALGAGRLAVSRDAAEGLARAADRAGMGVAILGVSLVDARPPREVQPDFDAAQAARAARDQRRAEARSVAGRTRAAAAAEAGARLQRARAEADRRVQLARAEAARFEALRDAARDDRALTVRRLHAEALRTLLPRAGRTIVLAPDEPLDLTLLPGAVPSPPPAPSPSPSPPPSKP
jgi:membrane protease subunit HflK